MTKIYPVVFFTFKRNATTTQFLELMRDAGVSKIYIYSDGPRNNVDKIATDLVRETVMAFQSANPNIKIIGAQPSDGSQIPGIRKWPQKYLPKIFDEDSQCIWIGAESGDVVEIKMLSDIAGETIQYRVVVPRSGRVIFAKEDQQDQQDEQNQATLDTSQEDDELEEHRELNTADELIADDVSDAEDTKEDHPDNHDE